MTDFLAHVDLIEVLGQATIKDGEFSWFTPNQSDYSELGASTREHSMQLQLLVDGYANTLDIAIQNRMTHNRQVPISGEERHAESGNARALRNAAQHERYVAATVRANMLYMAQFAEVLEAESGASACHAWEDRFCKSLCPYLMSPRWPDEVVEWLLKRGDVAEEQRASINHLYSEYVNTRRTARLAAVEAGAAAVAKHGRSDGIAPLQLTFARRLSRVQRTHDDFMVSLKANLEPELFAASKAYSDALCAQQPELCQEPIDCAAREAIRTDQ